MPDTEVYTSTAPTSHEVADVIRGLDQNEPERYIVAWEGETMDFDSTNYQVTKIGFGAGGRPTLEIEGGRGGNYVIDSNPPGKPKVKYLPPNGSPQEERLVEVKIYDTHFHWRNQILDRLGL